jgi:hypothetical protein
MPICSMKTVNAMVSSQRAEISLASQPADVSVALVKLFSPPLASLSHRECFFLCTSAHESFPQSVTTVCLAARAQIVRQPRKGFAKQCAEIFSLLIAGHTQLERESRERHTMHGARQTIALLGSDSIICCTSRLLQTASDCVFVLESGFGCLSEVERPLKDLVVQTIASLT